MKKFALALSILALLLVGTADAGGNMYWKDTFAGLDAIADSAGDRGVVITSGGVMTWYENDGAGWDVVAVTGGIQILSDVASPTAAQSYGSVNITSGAGTHTLPPVVAGMSTCIVTTTAAEITLELDNNDTFILDGVTMSAGEAIINTTAEAAGDYICVVGTSSVIWQVLGKQGTWTEATP
jgi:hypothetical protein